MTDQSGPTGNGATSSRGAFCLVLHTHLPWLAHHGRWPVGEEWLYQAWSASYLPLLEMLRRLSASGSQDLLTMGVTPVLAAQWDDPHCLRGFHHWLGDWRMRAIHATARSGLLEQRPGELGRREAAAAERAMELYERDWRHGGSAALRPLLDAGAVELLGGPLTHPFSPLLQPRLRRAALTAGLTDTLRRTGRRPAGIWAPECAFAPGMEAEYATAGVSHFLVDGPSLRGETSMARPVGDSGVYCFGRDLEVSYRVWSPKSGYPGDRRYRDFHTWSHPTGLKPARVTGKQVPPARKKPYDPLLASSAVDEHVRDFVATVTGRLDTIAAQQGEPGMVVAAFDTELFGHWWHEGVDWLEGVLRQLPEHGVAVRTLTGAMEAGYTGPAVELPPSSWGSGKDWRVWSGTRVTELVEQGERLQRRTLEVIDSQLQRYGVSARLPDLDRLLEQTLLALASDWAFMVSKDSTPDYARRRADQHTAYALRMCEHIEHGEPTDPASAGRSEAGRAFGGLDARELVAGEGSGVG